MRATHGLLLFSAVAAIAAACADGSPLGPSAAAPPAVTAEKLSCTADVLAGTVTCDRPPGSGAVRGAIIGGQGEFVRIASSNVAFDGATGTFSADLTVQNLLPYPIGTPDGTTADSAGVKVFFNSGPTATAGSGSVTVQNADGVGVFTATGQPFFRYAAPLAPGQTSAARSWQFHLDPGVTRFAFTLLVQAATPASAFRVLLPQPGDTVDGDSLEVVVVANAPPAVSLIQARVGPFRSMYLSYDSATGRWRGKMRLGLANGPYNLVVNAVAPGDESTQLVPFVFVGAPTLRLDLPHEGTVARPQLRVAGACVSSAECTITAYLSSNPMFTSTGATFDSTLSLAALDGTRQTLTIDGQTNRYSLFATRTVFVEATPRWVETAAAGAQILMSSPERVLYKDSTAAGVSIRIRELSSGADSLVVANAAGLPVIDAYATPLGAIFVLGPPLLGGNREVVEYRSGEVRRNVGQAFDGLSVDGRWVAWARSSTSSLYLRDVIGDSTVTLLAGQARGQTGGMVDPAVAANGDVVYTDTGGVLRRRRNGVVTTISSGVTKTAPVATDGNLIAFLKDQRLYLYDGTAEAALTPPTYQGTWFVRNGWVAFNGLATDGSTQVFVRTPAGGIVRVSPTPLRATIVALGDGGEVVFAQDGRRYHAAPSYAMVQDVGSDWGEAYPVRFHGSVAYTFLGRSAFRVQP